MILSTMLTREMQGMLLLSNQQNYLVKHCVLYCRNADESNYIVLQESLLDFT